MMFEEGFEELLEEFLLEARERTDEVEALFLQLGTAEGDHTEALARAKRELHTLKGNSGMMGYGDLQQLAHEMEDQLEILNLDTPDIGPLLGQLDLFREGLRGVAERLGLGSSTAPEADDGPQDDDGPSDEDAAVAEAREAAAGRDAGSVRLPFARIDQLVELQAETLIFRNRLLDAVRKGRAVALDEDEELRDFLGRQSAAWDDVEHSRQSLEKILDMLQDQVTNLGMVPLQGLFRSLRRLVHDEAAREGKTVELEVSGGDTPIDKTLLELAGDALGHLVRNAIIHGIEPVGDRLAGGKPPTGTVRLGATIHASEVWIEVADDGAGIDLEALRRRAEETHGPDHNLGSDFALLFEDGLSTRQDTDLSAGRGVGMAAVKRSVEGRGGRIDVHSIRKVGTTFTLRLPVTAAIMRSILVRVDGEDYALALTAVTETLQQTGKNRHLVNRTAVLRWRQQLIPILDLGRLFGTTDFSRPGGFALLIDVNGRFRALIVDEIVGIRDIVIKGLDSIVGHPPGISGSTILGDGRVVLILDPAALVSMPPFVESDPVAQER